MAAGDFDYVSTPQAAQALGVSVSTVKRWVDEGRLPAHKTAGGHRKLLRADVLALARQGELPCHDLTELFPAADVRRQLDDQRLATALQRSLLSGRTEDVRGLVRRAYRSGVPVERLADQAIAPAMRHIGHEWESARIDVWHEHRGSQLCLGALHELRAEVARRADRHRPVALGGAPSGDPYELATLLAQIVLLDAGWNAVNLGPDTPFENLLRAARELKPRLIWLSVSQVSDAPAFLREYRSFYRAAAPLGAAIAVGGRALTDALRAELPYTTHGDGLTHLAAFAQTLHPRPRPPRRGRPPKSGG
jgi:excisionase family DNA binding protein